MEMTTARDGVDSRSGEDAETGAIHAIDVHTTCPHLWTMHPPAPEALTPMWTNRPRMDTKRMKRRRRCHAQGRRLSVLEAIRHGRADGSVSSSSPLFISGLNGFLGNSEEELMKPQAWQRPMACARLETSLQSAKVITSEINITASSDF